MRIQFMNVRGVEANPSENFGVEGAAEAQVTAYTDAECPQFARAMGVLLKKCNNSTGICVVRGKRLVDLAPVSALRSLCVVGEYCAQRFEFVENFRHGDHKTVGSEKRSGASNGAGDVEDLGKQDYTRVVSGCSGTENVRAHEAAGRLKIGEFGVM